MGAWGCQGAGGAYGTCAARGSRSRSRSMPTRVAPGAAEWWRARFPDETRLPMPAEDLVRVIGALTEGLTFQRLLTPELISDELIYAAFAALAGGRTKPAS